MMNFFKYASLSLYFALGMTIQALLSQAPIIFLSKTCFPSLFPILIHIHITFSPFFTISLYNPLRSRSTSSDIELFDSILPN